MTVPEATVHKYDGLMLWEHQIGTAWQVSSMNPVAETALVKPMPERQFGFRIPTLDSTHDQPTLFRCQYVCNFVLQRERFAASSFNAFSYPR